MLSQDTVASGWRRLARDLCPSSLPLASSYSLEDSWLRNHLNSQELLLLAFLVLPGPAAPSPSAPNKHIGAILIIKLLADG